MQKPLLPVLNESQRRWLLELARRTISSALDGRVAAVESGELDDALRRPAGAFVTLTTRSGDLRGCIGSIEARAPLYQAVMASSLSAAFRDPRFPPVEPDEFDHLELEISVMGPLVRVERIEEIEVGRDGLIISRGRYAGLLLPQVATEYGWDREAFLSQTCVKAGLAPSAWRDGDCRIERFSAEVFNEKQL